jgi:hypothetical protein
MSYQKLIIEKQDEKLSTISISLTNLKQQAITIGDTLDNHNNKLEDISIKVDDNIQQVTNTTKRIEKFRKSVSSNLCWIMVFMIFINIILFIIFMKL